MPELRVVRVGSRTSKPQHTDLLLYSLYTHNCVVRKGSNSVVKFAEDTLVIYWITNNNKRAYLEEVEDLSLWCKAKSILLKVGKTKELVVEFWRKQ